MEKIKRIFGDNLQQYGLVIALILVVLVFQGLTGGVMLTPLNITNLLLQNSFVIILAIGMMFVIISGYFDMSVGSMVGLIGAIAGTLCVTKSFDPVLTIVICLLAGAAMGAFNGVWIAYLHVPAFVVTLGSQLVFKGLMLSIMKSASIGPFPALYSAVSLKFIADPFQGDGGFHPLALIAGAGGIALYLLLVFRARKRQAQNGLEVSGSGSFLLQTILICAAILLFAYMLAVHNGIPYVLILLVLLIAAYSFMGNSTTLGRRLYQVGGNEKAAALSGIRTKNITFFAFVNMGLLAALAGVVYSARLNFATPTAGDGFELDAIASCFIGGASPSGGVGTIRGAITGALIMGVLNNGMSLMGLGIETQKAVKGMVLILAVLLDVIGRRRAESK